MGFLLVIHVIVCIFLIGAILLQVGRGASTGASFGGGVGTFFGSTGAMSFLGKLVVTLTVIFVVTTILLYFISLKRPPKIHSSRAVSVASEMKA